MTKYTYYDEQTSFNFVVAVRSESGGNCLPWRAKWPIPIYTSKEESIIIRKPSLIRIRINCVYNTDNNTLIFDVVDSTENLAVPINNLSSYETYNSGFIGRVFF